MPPYVALTLTHAGENTLAYVALTRPIHATKVCHKRRSDFTHARFFFLLLRLCGQPFLERVYPGSQGDVLHPLLRS